MGAETKKEVAQVDFGKLMGKFEDAMGGEIAEGLAKAEQFETDVRVALRALNTRLKSIEEKLDALQRP